MDKGKQPAQGDWVTIAKKAIPREEKVYVVFSGRQPGIYTDWNEANLQVCGYSGASFKAYDSMTKAKKAFYSAPAMPIFQRNQMRTNPVPTNIQTSKPDESEIKDFFNPGISREIYTELNGVWKTHIVDNKVKFRKHMGVLANKLAEQTAKLKDLQNLCFNILKQMNWNEDFNFEKINNFLQLSDLISDEFSDPVFEQIKRICLFEKARTLLPKEIFMLIKNRVEDHHDKIRQILERSYDKLNLKDGIPKITIMANHDMWFFEDIDWGITNQVIFQILDPIQWIDFSMIIKAMLSWIVKGFRWSKYFTFWISSTVGWREREHFFQPYQIWYLKETEDFEFEDDYLDEDHRRERLENIQKLSLTEYWTDSLISVLQSASNIHGSAKLPFMVTDGRILFVTHFPITYQRSPTQINEALDMLINLKKRNNLDLPLELAMTADDVEHFRNEQYSQDPDSPPSETDEEYDNLINRMEA